LPDTRVKNAEPRLIPLPKMAVEILRTLPRFDGSSVFTASGRLPINGFSKLKRTVDAKITKLNGGVPIASWRFHDLRRTMRTNLSAIPTISPIVAELMIGHRQQGVLAVYDQHRYLEEQRAGFEAWCARLRAITTPTPDNVLKLRA